ncbi:MAG: hypothetical protein ACN6O2_01685 [Stenotrophomonas sp.]
MPTDARVPEFGIGLSIAVTLAHSIHALSACPSRSGQKNEKTGLQGRFFLA